MSIIQSAGTDRKIQITERDFQRLQSIAEPLVDTPASVVTKILDFFEQGKGSLPSAAPLKHEIKVLEFSSGQIPPLTHTKLLAGSFEEIEPEKATWDSLYKLALTRTFKRHPDLKELRRISGANLVAGTKEDEGYRPIPNFQFSYQGVSATDAAACVARCARALGCEAWFEFEWRQKDGAHAPGKRARVSVSR